MRRYRSFDSYHCPDCLLPFFSLSNFPFIVKTYSGSENVDPRESEINRHSNRRAVNESNKKKFEINTADPEPRNKESQVFVGILGPSCYSSNFSYLYLFSKLESSWNRVIADYGTGCILLFMVG